MFWGVFGDAEAYQEQIALFEKLNPSTKIVYERKPEDTYEQELIDALAAGRGPDIFLIHNSWLLKHRPKLAPLPSELLDLRALSSWR